MSTYTVIQAATLTITATCSWVAELTADQTATVVIATSKGATPSLTKTMSKNSLNTAFTSTLESSETTALAPRNYELEITVTDAATTPVTVAKSQHVLTVTQKLA